MMDLSRFTYIAVDLSALIVPFFAGFHPKLKFYEKPSRIFIPILLAAFPFILADHLFTDWGVWGFNPKFVLGIYIFNLPVEEYLFFLCIPFACLFTYHCFRVFHIAWLSEKSGKYLAIIIAVLLLLFGIYFYEKWYTTTTFIAFSIALFVVLKFYPNFHFARFFSVYLVILLPFFICNGILTGTGLSEPVVWYNDNENLGIRMFTIPFEDTFYGMLLIFLGCVGNEMMLEKNQS